MSRTFGAAWRAYRTAVPHWLPPLQHWPAWLCFGVGALLGAALWLFSPVLLGHTEPWDAAAPLWSLSWPAIGVLAAATRHLRGLLLPIGDAAGQVAVTMPQIVRSEFGVLGLAFIGGGLMIALAIALTLLGVMALWRRHAKSHLEHPTS